MLKRATRLHNNFKNKVRKKRDLDDFLGTMLMRLGL